MDIEKYYDKIYRYCYYRVNDRTVAEDLTQETFLRFLNSESSMPERYLYTIAKNLCIDEYRSRRGEMTDIEEAEIAQDDFADSAIEKMEIRKALELLPDEERELLILRYANEEPLSVICELTGISRFAVYRRIKEAKSTLEILLKRGES